MNAPFSGARVSLMQNGQFGPTGQLENGFVYPPVITGANGRFTIHGISPSTSISQITVRYPMIDDHGNQVEGEINVPFWAVGDSMWSIRV
jgi:hypothetical protein